MARLTDSLEPRREILEAYLFGSTARGSAQAHSDLDVAVYLADARPAASRFGYAADLAATLMGALGRERVDIVVLNAAPPPLPSRAPGRGQDSLARPSGHYDPRGSRPLALLRRRAAACQDRGRAPGSYRSRTIRSMSPGQADAAVVRRHLLALDAAVQRLRRHVGRPLSALSADPDARWAVERGLQLCAQNALDIGTHLAASAGRDAPDYASAVDILGELGVLPTEFARRFRGVAGFRNLLVHGYLAVELERVHEMLNGGLEEFVEFARHVESSLERR